MGHLTRLLLFLILVASVEDAARAQGSAPPAPKAPTDIQPGSITYEEIPYPYPVAYLPLTMYGQDVRMAYMDVPPAGTPNGRTVVLFHGMNFGGFYFGGPIELLRNAGFRVIVPDQIGFGRSSKPIIGSPLAVPMLDGPAGTRLMPEGQRCPPGSGAVTA